MAEIFTRTSPQKTHRYQPARLKKIVRAEPMHIDFGQKRYSLMYRKVEVREARVKWIFFAMHRGYKMLALTLP